MRKLSTRRFSRFHPHFKPASSVNWRNFMNQTNPPTKKILETSTRKKISSNKIRRPSRVALPPLTQDASGKERFSSESPDPRNVMSSWLDHWNPFFPVIPVAPRWPKDQKLGFHLPVNRGWNPTPLYRDHKEKHYKDPSEAGFHGSKVTFCGFIWLDPPVASGQSCWLDILLHKPRLKAVLLAWCFKLRRLITTFQPLGCNKLRETHPLSDLI